MRIPDHVVENKNNTVDQQPHQHEFPSERDHHVVSSSMSYGDGGSGNKTYNEWEMKDRDGKAQPRNDAYHFDRRGLRPENETRRTYNNNVRYLIWRNEKKYLTC